MAAIYPNGISVDILNIFNLDEDFDRIFIKNLSIIKIYNAGADNQSCLNDVQRIGRGLEKTNTSSSRSQPRKAIRGRSMRVRGCGIRRVLGCPLQILVTRY